MTISICTALFLSTLSLRRATKMFFDYAHPSCISIHALLAESDSSFLDIDYYKTHFYPRSPCGERPQAAIRNTYRWQISIHALLAESDPAQAERPKRQRLFLSTLSLRRATRRWSKCSCAGRISIHALLAESDSTSERLFMPSHYFYPRSPCGERRSGYR